MRLKIGIDISQVIYGTGVSVYTEELVRHLLKLDKKNEYNLFGGYGRELKSLNQFAKTLHGNFKKKFFPFPPTAADVIWNSLHTLPIELFTGKLDIYHSSDWAQAPSKAYKVTTVHDLVPIKFPNDSVAKLSGAHKARLSWVKKEVDKVIAVSKTTKQDLIEYGINAKKIIVIPEAPGEEYKPQKKEEIVKIKAKYALGGSGFIFAVGTAPRKNIERLVEAYKKIRKDYDLKLLIAGGVSKKVEYEPGVVYLGYVPQPEFVNLFAAADLLCYPSLYEGFGLTILQAMASGTPVVTSKGSSMEEVAFGAAELIDPKDVDSIANGIKKAIKNRKSLTEKGLARAKKYSWVKTARETLKIYMEAK